MSATRSPSRRRPEGSSPAKAVLEGSQVRKRLRYFPGVPSHYHTQLPNIFTDKSAQYLLPVVHTPPYTLHTHPAIYSIYTYTHHSNHFIHNIYTYTPSYTSYIHTPRHIQYIHPPYTVYTPSIYIHIIHRIDISVQDTLDSYRGSTGYTGGIIPIEWMHYRAVHVIERFRLQNNEQEIHPYIVTYNPLTPLTHHKPPTSIILWSVYYIILQLV